MGVSYRGIFSPSSQPLEEVLQKLASTAERLGLVFAGSAARLGPDFEVDLEFYAEGHDFEHGLRCEDLRTLVLLVRDWDGVSLLFRWRHLAGEAQTAILSEVDVYLSRKNGGCDLAFEEHRAINDCRQGSAGFERQFYALLVRLCEVLETPFCVYGDEISTESITPDRDTVYDLLDTGKFSTGGIPVCIVFDARQIDPAQVKHRIEAYGRQLSVSANGFGILRLDPDRDFD